MREDLPNASRPKLHKLLLVLDEFPQLGRMPTFETQMAAMAGYGMKAFIVCQSFNHLTRAYGRDNVILDNCHIVTAFAAADMETAKRIADMAGEAWEMRPQMSEQRPRAFLGARKGTITYREERRPLMLPGDVRQLPRSEQLIFVSGTKPLRAKKLAFDREPLFAQRLRPASKTRARLTIAHDWTDVVSLGRVRKEKKGAARSVPPKTQPDLFTPGESKAAQAPASLKPSPKTPPPSESPPPSARPSQRTGV